MSAACLPPVLGTIENALLARLKAASDSGCLGYRLKTLGSWQGQFDEPEALARMAPLFPGVWAIYTGGGDEPRSQRLWRHHAHWTLVVGTRNLRNATAGRLGGVPGEVGSYQIVQDVRRVLAGQRFGLEITPVVLGGVTSLWQGPVADQLISLYALDITVGLDLGVGVPDGWPSDATPGHGLAGATGGLGVASLTTLHLDWDPPQRTHSPLPDDADALAVDQITLPQGDPP